MIQSKSHQHKSFHFENKLLSVKLPAYRLINAKSNQNISRSFSLVSHKSCIRAAAAALLTAYAHCMAWRGGGGGGTRFNEFILRRFRDFY